MNKGVIIIEHTKPEQKEYFIEERKYANGETRFYPLYCYSSDPICKYDLNIVSDNCKTKKQAIDLIEIDISHTPIEIITYEYQS